MSLFGILREKNPLLEEAESRSLEMLHSTREMFRIVVHAIQQEATDSTREKLRSMDRRVNEGQQEVRQKVFEHLSLSQGQNLLRGLRLLSIVIDLERIGDYTKNMIELEAMFPGDLDLGPHTEPVQELMEQTSALFSRVIEVMKEGDTDLAHQAIDAYEQIARTCDNTLSQMMESTSDSPQVDRSWLAVVLLLRYVKRVSAHLKNACSAVVNPFHRIGFRPA